MKALHSILLFSLLIFSPLWAVPTFINYQGYVTDTNGDPIANSSPENRKILFKVYTQATGGTPVWAEEHTSTISEGRFSVLLGNGLQFETLPHTSDLSTVFASGTEYYIGVTVDNGDGTLNGSDTEISPRQRIVSSVFALRAGTADSVVGGQDFSLGTDSGIGVYDTNRQFGGLSINGPVVYGQSGGALGSLNSGTYGTALRWSNTGSVTISNGLEVNGNMTSSDDEVNVDDDLVVTGDVSSANATFSGVLRANAGLRLPGGFDPDPQFVGTAGNYISFGHSGSSEDFIGYKSQTFFFRDSVGGGDNAQPNVDVGGNLIVGGTTDMSNDLGMNDNQIFLRTRTDVAHGLGYFSTFASNPETEKVVFWGYNGGMLGSRRNGESDEWALNWDRNNKVTTNTDLKVEGKIETDGDITGGGDLTISGNLTVLGGHPIITGDFLRVVRGSIASDGTIQQGDGFTAVKVAGGTGRYQIIFDLAFPSGKTPTVTASVDSAGGNDFISVQEKQPGSFYVNIRNTASQGINRGFDFIAIGEY